MRVSRLRAKCRGSPRLQARRFGTVSARALIGKPDPGRTHQLGHRLPSFSLSPALRRTLAASFSASLRAAALAAAVANCRDRPKNSGAFPEEDGREATPDHQGNRKAKEMAARLRHGRDPALERQEPLARLRPSGTALARPGTVARLRPTGGCRLRLQIGARCFACRPGTALWPRGCARPGGGQAGACQYGARLRLSPRISAIVVRPTSFRFIALRETGRTHSRIKPSWSDTSAAKLHALPAERDPAPRRVAVIALHLPVKSQIRWLALSRLRPSAGDVVTRQPR